MCEVLRCRCARTSTEGSNIGAGAAGGIAATALLAVLPKCPACLAAYVTVATGLGVSLSTAAMLHGGLTIAAIGALAFFAARLIRRLLRRRTPPSASVDLSETMVFQIRM